MSQGGSSSSIPGISQDGSETRAADQREAEPPSTARATVTGGSSKVESAGEGPHQRPDHRNW